MKTFSYTCRDNTGALKKGTVQAADRSSALRQIKALNCIPVSVVEGGIVSSYAQRSSFRSKKNVIVFGAAAISLVIGLSLWRSLQPRTTAQHRATMQPTKSKTGTLSPVSKSAPSVPVSNPPSSTVHIVEQNSIQQASVEKNKKTRPSIAPQTASKPQTAAVTPTAHPPQPPKTFKTATEQLLAMAMSAPPGTRIPPLPIARNLNKDLMNSMTNNIVIYDDDDPRTVEMKENVAAAKLQLLEALKQGRDVTDVLQEYRDATNEKAAVRTEAQKEVTALYHAGKIKEANAYLEKINQTFKELGVEPVSLPVRH